ncbi:MAG: ribonuclease R [Tannerella sp.]|jgi:ribonuclease R|nr:ribonuclease R [Tannerella sp.]
MKQKRIGKTVQKAKLQEKGIRRQAVLHVFQTTPGAAYNWRQVARRAGAQTQMQKAQVCEFLSALRADGIVAEVSAGRFRLNSRAAVVEGVFQRRSNGRNAFIPDGGGEQASVSERNSRHAMNGDRVRVRLFARRRGGAEAEVVEITESRKSLFVGRLQVHRDTAFLVTEDRTLASDIFIPHNMLKGGRDNDKALVRIVEWPENAKNPIGCVVDILGVAGENNTEMHAILAEFGLPYAYPANAENAAARIAETVGDDEVARREDFRAAPTFTIDPDDAKDFDDALSLRPAGGGLWEAGVHIADVTHYVRPGTVIDREALQRATSVYLVDRTIPMLPDRLCNRICSLRPDEDKLCFSVVFLLDDTARIHASRICRTVIRSRRRFTYDEAQRVIETGSGDFRDEVLTLNRLAQQLRRVRFESGAIDFDRCEVKFDIDERGKPLAVHFKESKEANFLVEEFMLLANRTVAEYAGRPPKDRAKKTFVYRIHETPDPGRIENFATFIRNFGYKLKTGGSNAELTKSINTLLDASRGRPEANLIETLALRSMQKARYAVDNVGHYGLAFSHYTHFTSPIRRYPDMMVHRLLQRYLDGGRSPARDYYDDCCRHCSDMEQLAAGAERASVKYKQVEFMSGRIGQQYDGVISGVAEWGLYVELNENKCEGLIPVRHLDDDFYEYDEKNYCLRGSRHRRIYRLGDPVTITVAGANLERRQLDFLPA